MTQTPKLSDTQRILMSAAAQRAGGSFLPLPASHANKPEPARKSLASLLSRSLAAEQDAADVTSTWRLDGERRIGLVLTDAGYQAIDVVPLAAKEPAPSPARARRKSSAAPAPAAVAPEAAAPVAAADGATKINKRAQILKLMSRKRGASVDELMAATGWLPHTTRGAISVLRTKGITIERVKRGDTSYYRLTQAAK